MAGGRDAGTSSGMGAVPLRSAQMIGQPKKKKFFVVCFLVCNVTAVRFIFQVFWPVLIYVWHWQMTTNCS